MSHAEQIVIKGARQHNLKNIDLTLPRNKLIVITGLSGSGKSSLAFDTIYAEGQRRYVESLSAYARQFLGQMEKPDVDLIEGLSPAISIEQKTTSHNPRSTVGTVTEIYDYLRLLFARVGDPYCPVCGKPMQSQSIDQIIDDVMTLPEKSKIQILSPVVNDKKGEYKKELQKILSLGFSKVRLDDEIIDLSNESINIDKNKKHNIDIVVDRIVIKEGIRERLADSLETALNHSEGYTRVLYQTPEMKGESEKLYSEKLSCCGISYEELQPRSFSFNSPHGACTICHGLGEKNEIDPHKIFTSQSQSLMATLMSLPESYRIIAFVKGLAKKFNFNLNDPFHALPEKIQDYILNGTGDKKVQITFKTEKWTYENESPFDGIITLMMRRYLETTSDSVKSALESYMRTVPCDVCAGKRLKPEILAVRINQENIAAISDMTIKDCLGYFETISLSEFKMKIADKILNEILNRLRFLFNVGLGYISISRKAGTLSGGEMQRIRLATQIGSQLVGVLYVLDEPTIGLHQRDNEKLIKTLIELRDLGNTLIVVEHDEQTIISSDYIVDLGPRGGVHGGHVMAMGTPAEILNNKHSLTGQYISKKLKVENKKTFREGNHLSLKLLGATKNNLKNVDVTFPLGKLICVTGVSGSGKSTLINQSLFPALKEALSKNDNFNELKITGLEGVDNIDKIINIDQSPIGRTPRSNPATYTGLFTPIRELFANLPESRIRGYKSGRFSFNVKGGRCENCEGDGQIKIEMHFLPDIYVTCDVCKGKRYNRETLEVKYKGKSIYEVLDMTIAEAEPFFENIPTIYSKVKVLNSVGLGYIKLGQPATTLSGGEAQRVKLSTELAKRSTGKTLYLLDEPTTGLHFDDVKRLLEVLERLVDKGNTVILIEHNLDVIKRSDYIIDMGPEGGDEGGQVIATGTPLDIIREKSSYTGRFLKDVLEEKEALVAVS